MVAPNNSASDNLDEDAQSIATAILKGFSETAELLPIMQQLFLCQYLAGVFHRLQQSIAEDME